ncbi:MULTISPECIES: NlpC/P60 family protein [unclassified Amycolatopsis]|uniref:C40 family peptidase n=1 Tax=unclassified Amycolatopsis TaxID=2618356 RepID=UPI0028746C7F|nr:MULTISPECIES: NlpC/P60 family protein [unclassified Amycolatopsis]MDS0140560.1 C40 family peptidase [Amycolatopsis sp. 505]MDS0149210.1 C40 family peptidase [Amycolatopsis sp. CM201R]
MGRVLTAIAAVLALIAVAAALVTVVFTSSATGSSCDGARAVKHLPDSVLTEDQLGIVQVILAVVGQRQLPQRAAVIAVETALVESELRNLDHGDRDSLGVFQQRPSQGWGTPEQVMDPVYATGKFLDALVALPGWESMPPGAAAQAVQRSGFPDRYALREQEAAQIVAGVHGQVGDVLDPCVPPHDVDAPAAVQRALSQLGMPYCWGGGSPDGPTRGDGSSPPPCGPSSPGFDCSGLMLFAFAPSITLPRTSRAQYEASGGTHVPIADVVAGDMLFWANDTRDPGSIHHVALVVTPGQLVEAPEDGKTVQQRAYRPDSPGLMPSAVRMSR